MIQEFEPPAQKQVVSTYGPNAVSPLIAIMSGLFCTQEEADTRLLFHSFHSFHYGRCNRYWGGGNCKSSIKLQNCEVWIAFGDDNKLRYIPCHRIANKLGTDASSGLLFFHALSGCDTVSAFRGVGKKTARAIWCSMLHLDHIFARLSHAPKQIFTEDLKQLERVSCCSPVPAHNPLGRVNDARKLMFTQNRRIDNILPTLLALDQNVKRVAY